MPRRRNQTIDEDNESIDLQLTIRKNNTVSDFLRCRHFELQKAQNEDLECVICLQPVLECCYTLYQCGHYFHMRCISKLSKCPICRE